MSVEKAVAIAACGLSLIAPFAAPRFGAAAWRSARLGLGALFGGWPPDNQQFANVLHRGCLKLVAYGFQIGLALVALIVIYANLDQFVAVKAMRDFAQNRFAKPVLADRNDGIEPMGAGAQGAAFFGGDVEHAGTFSKAGILPGLRR